MLGALAGAVLAGAAPLRAQAKRRAPAPDLMGHGVSRTLAELRARTVRDVRYELALDVTALDSAIGEVTIRYRRTGTGDAILDFRGRRLTRAAANGRPLSTGAANGSHIRVPATLLHAGENVLEFGFVTDVAPTGASIIRSHDAADGSDYLYTLLVPADANQLFPCFDQPDLKARVRLSLTAPAEWTAVANGSLARADTSGARVTSRFAETQPISTYLIAFAAGPWAEATSVEHGRTVHAYVRRSRAAEADLDTLLALNQRALDWMEDYFGRPYPFEKFDFVLAPAFPFGGMEHPGAVFYSEDRFIFRERPTLPRRLGRFSTVLHETAHQWFGDLVTMRWFDDLWLKEGFATFMAAKALADIDPGAGAWKTFYLGNKPTAYAVDLTAGTRPLWQELDNLDQAKSNYGAIVYNKAPAVLKQLEYLVGGAVFQEGVQRFLARHAYGNATWQDLLSSVGRSARRPLTQFGRDFMLRPGMPVVEQHLETHEGRIAALKLTQRPAQGLSGPGPWTERTDILLAYRNRPPVVVSAELRSPVTLVAAATGRPAPDLVFANFGDYGYFQLLLDSTTVRTLDEEGLRWIGDPFLRAMLWGALWDEVRTFRLDPERFVRLALRELPAETDEQVVPAVLLRVSRAAGAYLPPAVHARVQPELEAMLWTGASDTARAYGVRKAYLDAFVQNAESPEGIVRLHALAVAPAAAGEPLRDPTRWEVVTRLLELAAPGADARFAAQRARDSTPDGRRRAFIAGAGVQTADAKREYFSRYFDDASLNEDWAAGSLAPFNTLGQEPLTLPYLRPALDSLPFIQANRRIFFLESWLGAFLLGQTGDSALAAVQTYLREHPDLPEDLRRKVLQHADELERTVRIRSRSAAGATPTAAPAASSPRAPR